MPKKIRVLIVDDSALMRKALREMLSSDPEIEVVGTARDGEDGVAKAIELEPDVITMDINMPGMDGLTALQYIVDKEICPVIMVSSLTQEGALATFEALELGAFDYVAKPGGTISLNIKKIADELIEKVKIAGRGGVLNKIRKRLRRTAEQKVELVKKPILAYKGDIKKAVAIGVSTGGPKTLMEIIPELPPDLDAVVFIVQHMPPNFTASFAKRLDQYSQIPIKEAEAGDVVSNNSGYLGKGGYHLLLRRDNVSNDIRIRLSTKPELLFVPSVNVMMEAVLDVFGKNTVGVLLTGMGDDGADAMVKIRRTGGITIAESEETAIVFGMPKEAIDRGGADIVAPSYRIAEEIIRAVRSL